MSSPSHSSFPSQSPWHSLRGKESIGMPLLPTCSTYFVAEGTSALKDPKANPYGLSKGPTFGWFCKASGRNMAGVPPGRSASKVWSSERDPSLAMS